ncbi:MAG TPA: methylenetetrahydrofolate reductase [Candidatus Acidoferrales bacterium]|nr:methylenetetrahydrofolate reductase [Candidatus Acidoferrales bacterium]
MTNATASAPSVAEMLKGFSIELNPGDGKVMDAAPGRLEPGTEVFLTWIPGTNPMETIAPAGKLRKAGLFPTPHIGARHVESAAQLEEFASRLAAEGVDRVLIIGGDRDKPAGPYDSSLAVMQSGILQKAGITRINIGAFPEGNPAIPDALLIPALPAKVNFAKSNGLQTTIVTQFCFDAEPILKWLHLIRGQGIDLPIRVGLAGPASIISLTRYALKCGVGNSIKVLTEKPAFAKLLVDKGPEPIIRDVAAGIGPAEGGKLPLGITGLHFFVFGGFNKTVDWIQAQRAQ